MSAPAATPSALKEGLDRLLSEFKQKIAQATTEQELRKVYADYGGKWSFEAAKLAVEDFGGSVLGQKIEVISADHQNKPDILSATAREWFDT